MLVVYDRAVRSLNYSKAEKPSVLFGTAYKGCAAEEFCFRRRRTLERDCAVMCGWTALLEILCVQRDRTSSVPIAAEIASHSRSSAHFLVLCACWCCNSVIRSNVGGSEAPYLVRIWGFIRSCQKFSPVASRGQAWPTA